MTNRALVVVATVISGVLAPGAAAETWRFKRLETATRAGVHSDGVRWVAWSRSGGQLRILDTATGRRRTVDVPEICGPTALAAGTVLLSCRRPLPVDRMPTAADYDPVGALVDVRSGRTTPAPSIRLRAGADQPTGTYADIGRRWIRISVSGYHYGYDVYVDRTTGRSTRAEPDARSFVDLDLPQLIRPLCRPVQRDRLPLEPGFTGLGFSAASFDRPDVVLRRRTALYYQRCGSAAPKRIGGCFGGYCGYVQLGGGWVTWIGGRPQPLGRAFVPSTRRAYTAQVPRGNVVIALAHTRRHAVATAAMGAAPSAATQVLIGPKPR